ncbi:MAG: QueT transporter family protein [Syntrophothermus sp.]
MRAERGELTKTRQMAEIGLIAAIYVVLVYLLAPISFTVLQFRVAEIIKPMAIFRKHTIWAMAAGVGIANLSSPYAGAWELVWMPLMNLAGGYLAWLIGNKVNVYAGAVIFAAWIALAVAVMLSAVANLPFWPAFGSLIIPEILLVTGGVPLMRWISERVDNNFK